MMEEEGAVIGGLLVGLNVIDANLCIKGEDLDCQVSGDAFLLTCTSQQPDLILPTVNSSHTTFNVTCYLKKKEKLRPDQNTILIVSPTCLGGSH